MGSQRLLKPTNDVESSASFRVDCMNMSEQTDTCMNKTLICCKSDKLTAKLHLLLLDVSKLPFVKSATLHEIVKSDKFTFCSKKCQKVSMVNQLPYMAL